MPEDDAALRDSDLLDLEADAPPVDEWQEAAVVGAEVARAAWTEQARDVLMETARHYQHVVTYKELAAAVQDRTRIRTGQMINNWVGDVLRRVSEDCAHRDEPLLSALCVNAQGSVGEGYAATLVSLGRPAPADADDHAARERLACYQHFDAKGLPASGGLPALVPKLAAARTRARKASFAERVRPLCPKCNLELSAAGFCDNCD